MRGGSELWPSPGINVPTIVETKGTTATPKYAIIHTGIEGLGRGLHSNWASGLSDRELSIECVLTLSSNAIYTPATSDETYQNQWESFNTPREVPPARLLFIFNTPLPPVQLLERCSRLRAFLATAASTLDIMETSSNMGWVILDYEICILQGQLK